jgi:hypothetical protein
MSDTSTTSDALSKIRQSFAALLENEKKKQEEDKLAREKADQPKEE